MAMRFSYNNINFKRDTHESSVIITGEITNNSGRDFSAVVFRMVLFVINNPIGNINITINGFSKGQTKTFKQTISELDLGLAFKITPKVIRYQIYPESSY